jgi:4-oxalocrotonate tautomerase
MVVLKVTLLEGRSLAKKRELARRLSEAAARFLGEDLQEIRLVFYEVSKDDWAVGGVLLRDKEEA